MNLNDLERRFGRYAIPNLSLIMIGVYILGFILQAVAPGAMYLLSLDPYQIIHNFQIWRLVSWLVTPPYTFGIFTIINLYFIYMLGRMLERIWGNFRYNLYVLGGILTVIVGIFAIYGFFTLTGATDRFEIYGNGAEVFSRALGSCVSTYYIMISVILAFSMTVPDMEVRLYFIIPLKMKWLAYLDMGLLFIQFLGSPLVEKLVMVISLLNFIIFMIITRKGKHYNTGRGHRQPSFFGGFGDGDARRRGFRVYDGEGGAADKGEGVFGGHPRSGQSDRPAHKCVVCGITDRDAPRMMFRYCSKCNGSYEYCEDHLYTHTHVE